MCSHRAEAGEDEDHDSRKLKKVKESVMIVVIHSRSLSLFSG